MDIPFEVFILAAAVLIFCSILISRTGYRFGIPTLLMFLLAGMLFGTDGLGIQFDNVTIAQNIGMLALSVILFTGGMDTKITEIRPVMSPGLVLATMGVLLTCVFTGLFVYGVNIWVHPLSVTGVSFLGCLLLSATMSSTDSASVFNILRSQKIGLKHNLRPMLELESGSNDPMAYLLTLVLIQCMQLGNVSGFEIVFSFFMQFAVGLGGGFLFGKAAVWLVNHVHLKNVELYSTMVLTFIFITYSTVYLLEGNGYLAVYVAGMVMGNSRLFMKREVTTFLNGMTWLFQVVMFLILGLLVNPRDMLSTAPAAILIGLFMMFAARPLSVWLCLLPFGRRITGASKVFISWVGLRGAAPIIFAMMPVVAGVEGGGYIFNIVFFVTLLSLLVQGMSLSGVARRLGLTEEMEETPDYFGIEMPEELGTGLHKIVCTDEMLSGGALIRDISFPPGMLVMLVRRGERHIVPNGSLELLAGDELLLIKDGNPEE